MKRVLSLVLALTVLYDMTSQNVAPLAIDEGATQVALVVDVVTGEVVYEYDSWRRVTPASLTKLFTTAAVFTEYGPLETFKTDIYWNANDATLVVKGSCDPTIGSKYLQKNTIKSIAEQISATLGGETTIEKLIVDESYMSGVKYVSKRLWEDMGNYYGAACGPININDNTFAVTLSSPKEYGNECRVETTDSKSVADVESYVRSYSGRSDSAYLYGIDADCMYISGAIPAGRRNFKVKGAIPDPSAEFLSLFSDCLRQKGTSVREVQILKTSVGLLGEHIARIGSPTIFEISQQTNRKSLNLYADALWLKFGEDNGRTSVDSSVKRLNGFVEHATGEKALLYDGAGLSPMNKTTAAQVVKLLRYMANSTYAEDYINTLAVAGCNGTLANFCKSTPLDGSIMGKSGSMSGVRGYAGYVKIENANDLAFCIIVNNHVEPTKELVNKIERWLVKLVKK